MNYIQKNRKNIIIAVISLLLLAAIIILWLQRKVIHSSDDIVAAVYPTSLNVGDTLTFEDKTTFGKTRKWDFGDGFNSDKNKGSHFFKKPGYYQVSVIIDNKYTKSFPVLVSGGFSKPTDTTKVATKIDAPTQAMQLENVFFRADSPDAKIFTWKFGETGNIDAKEKMATYAFKNPGNYIVTLYTDVDNEPIQHMIKILPAYEELDDEVVTAPTVTDIYSKINDDFKYHLQQIANGNNFNSHYNYLLSTYLCNKDNIGLTVNDKNNSFYNYCMGLQFDKNNSIQEVKTTLDTNQNCVVKVEVKQSK
ncbi:PKD domain-containing protein [Epilithonimonas zeae]|uniref:PKD domain-containing protein n=1 Tax=Epilithonimonas zeae TaxID=1416779 RepID=A0A1N6F9F1_9FLAO|nr:PKD domain-containing protein [Epilithonimonas zeae]SIN91847.1 PKD domain-containing protein [Epilithonimonas zeae]